MTRDGSNSTWLRSPAWDGFWMLSGIWLPIPLLALSSADQALQVLLIVAVFALWLPHRFATAYNAFCTPAYRTLVLSQKRRFVALPVLVLAATFLFVFAPRQALPLTAMTRIQVLATIFFLYNAYHFAVQHYGILSIYRIRAGQPHAGWLKRYERTYCLAVGMVIVTLAQVCHGADVVRDSLLYDLIPRESFQAAFRTLRVVMPCVVVALSAVLLAGEMKIEQRSPAKILYIIGIALQGVLAYYLNLVAFVLLWGVQHWLVSVALAGHMAENDSSESPASSRWYGFWQWFNRGFWPSVLGLCALTLVLAPLFEYSLHDNKIASAPRFLSWIANWVENSWRMNFFIALNFGTVYIHFIMDRAVFRFSNPEVRQVTAPLLFAKTA